MSEAVQRVLASLGGDTPDTRRAWAAFVAAATASWPGLVDHVDAFARAVENKLSDARELAQLDAGEIGLACGCAVGDAAALRSFDTRFVAGLDPDLVRAGLHPSALDDIKQRVRTKLLTPDGDGTIKLLGYAGQGRLAGLVKVVAVRMALDVVRARSPEDNDTSVADAIMDHGVGPELEAVHRQHREAVRSAFAEAVSELEPSDRALLRMHLLQRLPIDGIAALHRVHRATAARWIARLRDAIAVRTRAILSSTLALDEPALASLFRAVDSHLDLSLSRLLAPEDP